MESPERAECMEDNNEQDDKGNFIHPLKRTPLIMCKCGKPWTSTCILLTHPCWTIDPVRFNNASTPQDSSAMIRINNGNHGPLPILE
jgi:hypothetical protein